MSILARNNQATTATDAEQRVPGIVAGLVVRSSTSILLSFHVMLIAAGQKYCTIDPASSPYPPTVENREQQLVDAGKEIE